ncbi:glutamate receptor ionotropic, kainate 2 [Lepeophtheirus salmonis]|nr:glutamate receptor ionotropic, kainate 2-like [Lepeophtheirus salmonis]
MYIHKGFPYFYNENPEEFLGVDKNVVESIGVKMNYDLKYKVSVDGNFGAMSEEGNFSFNGMVGMVQRREVDCALSAITKSYIRSKVIDFSIGTYNTHASFITRKTGPVAKWRAMLNPFGINVWIALILTLIGFLSSYHFILKLSYHETTLSFQTSFLNIWGSFFNQTIIHPKKTSSRILMGSWFLFSICIVASYGGSLRSFLTLPLAKTPIDYLDGLVKSPLMIIILKGSIFENVFRDSKDNIFQRLWNKALTHNAEDVKCSNITTCIKLVKEKPGMSFIFDEDILESTVLTLPESQSNIRMARGAFFPSEYAIVFRKNAPYLDRFNEYLLKVKEAGLVEHWRRSALFRRKFENMGKELLDKNKKEMKEEEESVNEPITLDHLQGALMLYACGIGISLLIYISEKMLNPPHRHRKEKRRWIS